MGNLLSIIEEGIHVQMKIMHNLPIKQPRYSQQDITCILRMMSRHNLSW